MVNPPEHAVHSVFVQQGIRIHGNQIPCVHLPQSGVQGVGLALLITGKQPDDALRPGQIGHGPAYLLLGVIGGAVIHTQDLQRACIALRCHLSDGPVDAHGLVTGADEHGNRFPVGAGGRLGPRMQQVG